MDLVGRFKSLVDKLVQKEPEKPLPLPVVERHTARRRTLRCDIFLTTGPGSLRLFAAGQHDELAFYQRFSIGADHDVEFLTRLDGSDRGTENFRAYGIFRLKGPWRRLPEIRRDRALASRLEQKYGLERLPHAARMAPASFAEGTNRLTPPAATKPLRKVRGRCFYFADLLEIMRAELNAPQTIAWLEEALPPPPPHSPIVHRYYLDARKQAWLVRDVRGAPKRLYVASTSAEAEEPCLVSTRTHARRSAAS